MALRQRSDGCFFLPDVGKKISNFYRKCLTLKNYPAKKPLVRRGPEKCTCNPIKYWLKKNYWQYFGISSRKKKNFYGLQLRSCDKKKWKGPNQKIKSLKIHNFLTMVQSCIQSLFHVFFTQPYSMATKKFTYQLKFTAAFIKNFYHRPTVFRIILMLSYDKYTSFEEITMSFT